MGPILKNKNLFPPDSETDAKNQAWKSQLEHRDTKNAADAKAIIAFVKPDLDRTNNEKEDNEVKATLNLFAHGRYGDPVPNVKGTAPNVWPPTTFNIGIMQGNKRQNFGTGMVFINEAAGIGYQHIAGRQDDQDKRS